MSLGQLSNKPMQRTAMGILPALALAVPPECMCLSRHCLLTVDIDLLKGAQKEQFVKNNTSVNHYINEQWTFREMLVDTLAVVIKALSREKERAAALNACGKLSLTSRQNA